MAKKAAARRGSRSDGPKGADLDTSNDTAPAKDPHAERQRRQAAHQTRSPIPVEQNPPAQPTMIPAKQIPGATGNALDPEDLPANRRNPANTIRVQAKAIGYYDDKIRRVGDVFDIADEKAFSSKWMRRVAPTTPERLTNSNQALARQKQGEAVNEEAPEPRGAANGDVLGD